MQKSRVFLVLGASVLTASSLYAGSWWNEQSQDENKDVELPSVGEAYERIVEKSVYSPSSDQLVEGAIRGMADSIGDPYSTYYTSQEAKQHRQSLAEERVGIGIEITLSGQRFVVVSPVRDSPAEKAGIRPYDELVQVGKERLDGRTMADLLTLLQGEEGTEVTIVVYRPSVDKHLEMKLKRAAITNKTVSGEVVEAEGVKLGIVNLSLFGENTAEEWLIESERLLAQGVEGIVVDVRGNPGGYLHSVAALVSTLAKDGKVFAYMQNSEGEQKGIETQKLETEEGYKKKMESLPLVLLQNEGSASASEVLSGALKEWGRAIIVGSTSFGKGTVQDSWELSNGGELKLSTNKWLTPRREWIHGKGIEANIPVEQNELFQMEMMPLRGEFRAGDMGEEIAYVQEVLAKLGYSVGRTDGYFDKSTEAAVLLYRKKEKLPTSELMDTQLFSKIHEHILMYKEDKNNDTQLQMGLSVLMHKIEQES